MKLKGGIRAELTSPRKLRQILNPSIHPLACFRAQLENKYAGVVLPDELPHLPYIAVHIGKEIIFSDDHQFCV